MSTEGLSVLRTGFYTTESAGYRGCIKISFNSLDDMHKADDELRAMLAAPTQLQPDRSAQAAADSIALMVTEWVESGIKMDLDWRNGLSGIIARRLARFGSVPPQPDQNAQPVAVVGQTAHASPETEVLPLPGIDALPVGTKLYAHPLDTVQRDAQPVSSRSAKDYAIEHAEYMAKAADHVMSEFQTYGLALIAVDEGGDDGEGEIFEAIDSARSDLQEALVDLRSMVFEFRKRSARAITKP
ncbi:MAG: hypothetical protein ACOH2R_28270 [Pseudomonas sp.]